MLTNAVCISVLTFSLYLIQFVGSQREEIINLSIFKCSDAVPNLLQSICLQYNKSVPVNLTLNVNSLCDKHENYSNFILLKDFIVSNFSAILKPSNLESSIENYYVSEILAEGIPVKACKNGTLGDFVKQEKKWTYMVSVTTSAVIYLAIFTSYLSIWKMLNDHSWTVATFCFSMFSFFVFAAIAWSYEYWHIKVKTDGLNWFCTTIGILQHFFIISISAWFACLNFDIFYIIRSTTPLAKRRQRKRRYCTYNIIGFGVPLVVVIVSIIIDFGELLKPENRPQYGLNRCYLDSSVILRYEIPITATMSFLCIIFGILTVVNLMTTSVKGEPSQNRKSIAVGTNQIQFRRVKASLFAKLFVIMGFSWTIEIIFLLASDPNYKWYWVLFDIYNVIQGSFLFYMFVLSKEIREKLAKKHEFLSKILEFLTAQNIIANSGESPSVGTISNIPKDQC